MNDDNFLTWESAVQLLIDDPSQEALVRACYFDRPVLEAAFRFWSSEEWATVRSFLPSLRGQALDIGAGMGIASYALARDGWNAVAVEPDSSSMVGARAIEALAQASGLPIQIVNDHAEQLSFPDASFDLVHARQVLHHAADLEALCCEVFRVLKPGGIFIATREHVISGPSQLQAFLDRHPLHSLYGGEHAFTLEAYRRALIGSGLTIKKVLGPLESVINFAPLTEETLCAEISIRLTAFPLGKTVTRTFFETSLRSMALRVLSACDRRPGRLYTFVCQKG